MTPRSCGALHDVWRIVTSLRPIHTSSTQIHTSLRRMHTSQSRTGYCNLLSLVRIFGCRIDAPAFGKRKSLLVRACMHFTLAECWPVKPKSSQGGFSLGIRLWTAQTAHCRRRNCPRVLRGSSKRTCDMSVPERGLRDRSSGCVQHRNSHKSAAA